MDLELAPGLRLELAHRRLDILRHGSRLVSSGEVERDLRVLEASERPA
jgi:hypothetical protein